nr:MAG TPA: hypothetical protein [Caudoviricetes sp.]
MALNGSKTSLYDVGRVSRDTLLKSRVGGAALAGGCLYTLPRARAAHGCRCGRLGVGLR